MCAEYWAGRSRGGTTTGYGNDEREGNEKKRKNVKRRDRNKIKMCLERSIVGEGETQN